MYTAGSELWFCFVFFKEINNFIQQGLWKQKSILNKSSSIFLLIKESWKKYHTFQK